MDPQDYFCQVSSLGSQFSKKVIQITKRSKMGEIRVLTEKWPNFDFLPNNWLIGWKHDLKDPSASFWPNFIFQFISWDKWIDRQIQSTGEKSQLYTKKSNFDFLTKIESQKSHFIKTSKIWNLIIKNQENKKSNFARLVNFSKYFLYLSISLLHDILSL